MSRGPRLNESVRNAATSLLAMTSEPSRGDGDGLSASQCPCLLDHGNVLSSSNCRGERSFRAECRRVLLNQPTIRRSQLGSGSADALAINSVLNESTMDSATALS